MNICHICYEEKDVKEIEYGNEWRCYVCDKIIKINQISFFAFDKKMCSDFCRNYIINEYYCFINKKSIVH